MDETCGFCGNRDIIYEEYSFYDGVVTRYCNQCNRRYHLYAKKEVIGMEELEQYGPVKFIFIDGTYGINRCFPVETKRIPK